MPQLFFIKSKSVIYSIYFYRDRIIEKLMGRIEELEIDIRRTKLDVRYTLPKTEIEFALLIF